jgi:DMSO/TMAO reductase YedYZ molybdopterin-dependent catalytic subunit
MATSPQDVAPDAVFTSPAAAPPTPQPDGTDRSIWYGWPSQNIPEPRVLRDEQGRITRIRTPVLDLEGHMTPTHLFYVVQHFAVPEPVPPEEWRMSIDGEVKEAVTLSYEDIRRLPARTVRTVMECSGSDADFFEYFKGDRSRPVRATEGMILSAGEFTGVPLATVLAKAGLNHRAAHVRVEGWDQGVPPSATPGTAPFYYDKGLPVEKALHPDTILAWAQNGELLEHLHGAPIRLLVPGWSGNWSVKWVQRIEVTAEPPDCWYHWQFYYYGTRPDDPHKELITTIGVRSLITFPRDDQTTLSPGTHVIRGRAWSGAGAVSQVEISLDGGTTWHATHLEPPHERWLWRRWSYVWEAQPGQYQIMSRATDEVGRVEPQTPRYNNMRKNFSAIVGLDVTVVED